MKILYGKPKKAVLAAIIAGGAAFFGAAVPLMGQEKEEEKKTSSAAGVAIGSRSKSLEGESLIRERIEGFFAALEDGKVRTAFEQLLKDSAIGEEQGNLEALIQRTNEVLTRFGEVESHELMKARRKGTRLVAYAYLSHGEVFPLQWEIFCYKGSKGWQVLDITVNNDLVRIFAD